MASSIPRFALVTGNPDKLIEAQRLFGHPLDSVAIDLPEIQGMDLQEVLRAKAEEAWRRVGRPLVVEETGLEVDAFGGFPGPLVKWMLESMGAEGIARAALALDRHPGWPGPGVKARCALLFTDGRTSVIAEGVTAGRLVLPARGSGGFGWDPVFQPLGESLTYGELSPADKDRLGHRGRAWRALLGALAQDRD